MELPFLRPFPGNTCYNAIYNTAPGSFCPSQRENNSQQLLLSLVPAMYILVGFSGTRTELMDKWRRRKIT